jgi:hypothetical protein
MNYDDYGAFNLDIGDQSYDWNSKSIAQPFKLCKLLGISSEKLSLSHDKILYIFFIIFLPSLSYHGE